MSRVLDRRQVLRGASLAGGGLALSAYMPAWAQPVSAGIAKPLPTVSGEDITLKVAHQMMMIDGRQSHAIGINGTVPAPLIRLREGQNVRLHVVNELDEETSIHWHGLLLPFQMDGVPGSPSRHSGALDLHLRVPDHPKRDLLVSQPFRASGAGGTLRPDPDRSEESRSRAVRSRACDRAVRPQLPSPALPL